MWHHNVLKRKFNKKKKERRQKLKIKEILKIVRQKMI